MGNVNDGTLSYLQIDSTSGVPAATDCDDDAERGRILVDYLNNQLIICNGATRGWDTVALTN